MRMYADAHGALDILGGGPAGLAAAYYARKAGLDFTVYEASSRVGGNCQTLRVGDFRFDTGAHRLHDKDPAVTREIRALLGDDLLEVHAPSQIFWNGQLFDFPLAPLDLLSKLDAGTLLRMTAETVRGVLRPARPARDFRQVAIDSYGETLAGMFLLNYSEKLWGERTENLSPRVAGGRLKGLDLRSFLLEAVRGKRRRDLHLDGSFFYPKYGIGMIFDRVAEAIGPERIRLDSRVERLRHDGRRITGIGVNGRELEAGTVLSTLPLSLTLRMLEPAAPAALLELAGGMRYRHLVLGVFLLDRPSFSPNASLYFPDRAQPYTRVYESKNRSPFMAPPARTAIVVEIPCERGGDYWTMEEPALERVLRQSLEATGMLREGDVLAFRSRRVPFAYPVLEVGFERKASALLTYLRRFENLRILGRSGLFRYTHIHDMFRLGRTTIDSLAGGERDAPALLATG